MLATVVLLSIVLKWCYVRIPGSTPLAKGAAFGGMVILLSYALGAGEPIIPSYAYHAGEIALRHLVHAAPLLVTCILLSIATARWFPRSIESKNSNDEPAG